MKSEFKHVNAVKLGDGISCDPSDIGSILLEVHNILKKDSNIVPSTNPNSNRDASADTNTGEKPNSSHTNNADADSTGGGNGLASTSPTSITAT